MKSICTLLFVLMILLNCRAQENNLVSNSSYSSGIKQVKESANFGLVFTGPSLNYSHYLASTNNNRTICIENQIGAAIPFSKGIPALSIHLKPAEVSYLFYCKKCRNKLSIGPLLKFEYDYTLYPQLQSAFDYWFTNFSLGLNSSYNFHIANQLFETRLKLSVFGLTSRQPDYRNPYFYDIGFKYAIQHSNSGLEFSGPGKYNTIDFEISWKPKPASRFTWNYCFNYAGYYKKPTISIVSHNIKLTINKKNKS